MIELKRNSIVYVLCPAYSKTGGPELLHQLVYNLNKNGINAKITYYNLKTEKNYTPDDFKKYVNSYEVYNNILDDENNCIIFPEILTNKIKKFKKSKKAIWWLSVDNYFKHYGVFNCIKKYGIKSTLYLILKGYLCFNNKHLKLADYHLCQSYYAIDFLKKLGIDNSLYLSDYINNSYLECVVDYNNKKNNVLYNPKKGFEFTKKLIDNSPELNWIPIQNLTTEQVKELLLESKVYVDFGNHPGKDRFPRESAICGCCVITSKNGSASYYDDVPINDDYKFDCKDENIDKIVQKIKNCLNNYENEIKNFDGYRKKIKSEENIFKKDVLKIFQIH